MANPSITALPEAPQRRMARDTYPVVADKWAAALGPWTTQVNDVVTWMGQQIDAAAASKKAAEDSATAAGKSVSDAAAQVKLASDQAANAQTSANQAAGFRDSAQAAAAAAQSSAGLPAISGKTDQMLSVNAAGNGVEYRASVPRPTSAAAGYAVVVNPAGNGYTTQMIPVSPITKYYESAAQTIAANGSFSVSHGLGVVPKGVTAYLVCQTDFGGYVAGDRVEWPISQQVFSGTGNDTSRGGSVSLNATTLSMKFGLTGGPVIIRKDNGSLADSTPYFKIVLRAFA